MIYLPDTNAWIRFLNPGASPVKGRFLAVDHSVIRLCSVVKAELYFGAMKGSRKNENLELLDALFAKFPSLPFGDDAALEYGRIRLLLARQGTADMQHESCEGTRWRIYSVEGFAYRLVLQ